MFNSWKLIFSCGLVGMKQSILFVIWFEKKLCRTVFLWLSFSHSLQNCIFYIKCTSSIPKPFWIQFTIKLVLLRPYSVVNKYLCFVMNYCEQKWMFNYYFQAFNVIFTIHNNVPYRAIRRHKHIRICTALGWSNSALPLYIADSY